MVNFADVGWAMKGTKGTLLLVFPLLLAGCTPDSETYTLYRTSVLAPFDQARIHVASFDAADGAGYNNENCNLVGSLLEKQPGIEVRYWCEQGRFKK